MGDIMQDPGGSLLQPHLTSAATCTHCWHQKSITVGRTASGVTTPQMQCCWCGVTTPWNAATPLGHGPYLPT